MARRLMRARSEPPHHRAEAEPGPRRPGRAGRAARGRPAHPAPGQQAIGAPARRRSSAAAAVQADRHRRGGQAHGAVPGQCGESDGADDDHQRGQPAGHSQAPAPRAGQREHAEHDGHVLQQADHPLGDEPDPEHLVDGGQHPEAPGAIEVQEVAVGDRAVQQALGKHQHEPLFHRGALVVQEAAKGQREPGTDDRHGHQVAPPAGQAPCGGQSLIGSRTVGGSGRRRLPMARRG